MGRFVDDVVADETFSPVRDRAATSLTALGLHGDRRCGSESLDARQRQPLESGGHVRRETEGPRPPEAASVQVGRSSALERRRASPAEAVFDGMRPRLTGRLRIQNARAVYKSSLGLTLLPQVVAASDRGDRLAAHDQIRSDCPLRLLDRDHLPMLAEMLRRKKKARLTALFAAPCRSRGRVLVAGQPFLRPLRALWSIVPPGSGAP